ncbi:hypothetical protein M378DRAFT_66367 [Amanita muscaria Koide BX008]|uniref:Peptidase S26 domain-containing protein n=1 Tax=Amanita muscaria (strain Koide BX008) TaxID=946122 RepID=A0A0C2XNB8_AMAMK|nr:hypothetical protein M378DRAFT_66367 [Amanita muscaria Koide BX008]
MFHALCSYCTLNLPCKVVNTFCLVHLIFEYIGRPSPMAGLSMLPTLASEGEIVIEDRLTYRFWPIQRGDIVTLKSPLDPNRIVCKRVFGLPGDTICVDPTGSMAPSTEHVVIPRGHIWICGDNAAFSRDSREYGPIPMALVEGKLAYRVSATHCPSPRNNVSHSGMATKTLYQILKPHDVPELEITQVHCVKLTEYPP